MVGVPNGPPWPCVGVALVRRVDVGSCRVELVSDVPPALLACVDGLLVGEIGLPLELWSGHWSASPFVTRLVSREALGTKRIRSANQRR